MLLEILSQKLHVFDGGDNDHQLDSVAEVVGGRPLLAWAEKYRVKLSPALAEKLAQVRGVPLETLIPYGRRKFRDKDALNLAERMLDVDHKQRITAEETLGHPFFQMVREADAAKG
jgi:casein kinase II subunit alpha